MSYNSSVYNKDYYKSHCGENYERGNGWEEIFSRHAERIIKELNPKTVLDVGCATGYLVEGLRDRGVEAYGIDVSEYAISNVRDDIKQFCIVKSATCPIEKKYDLITCIEVMEHLSPDDFTLAIDNMCNASDTIIFSSTPFDYNEESHFSVNATSFWVEKFAYNGFYHDVSYDCSYIAVQTMLFRRGKKSSIDLIRTYEEKLFSLWRENCMLRDSTNLANARISDLDRGNIEQAQEREQLKSHIVELQDKINEMQEENCMLRDSTNLANARISDLDRGNIEQAQEREQLKSQIVDNENKFREIIKEQYEKRDNLENKILISIKHNEFLEQELFKYQNLLQNSQVELEERKVTLENKQAELEERKVTLENKQAELEESKATLENKQAELEESKKMLRNQEKEIKEISRELDKYRKSKFIRNCYFIENRIESVKGKCGKHSNRKLMKKDKDYWKPVFDSIEYCKYNPDIYHIIGNDEKALLKHFIYYGMNEGRIASCNFDIYAYCECNPDVKDLYGDNLKEIYLHYIEYGVNENRRSIW